jgi:hypothetical protein
MMPFYCGEWRLTTLPLSLAPVADRRYERVRE